MSDRALIAALCAGEALTMIGVFAFPALLPAFIAEWSLSKAEAGWIGGITFLGYALAAPPLLLLTDRVDARRIWIGGALLTATAALGFAAAASGFWSALALRFAAGAGLAATYMPGLKVLVERYRGTAPSRAVATYTATFSLGTALSFFAAGWIADAVGWRAAFVAAGIGAIAAAVIGLGLRPRPAPAASAGWPGLRALWQVVGDRPSFAYVLGYGVHCWELFSLRTWLVALLAFTLTVRPVAVPWPTPAQIAALSGIVAMAASIGGNELCLRLGRRRTIVAAMLASMTASAAIGFAAGFAYATVAALALVYAALVQLDSGALIAGALATADPKRHGATLALMAFCGFGCGAVGPLAVGIVLDATGGGQTVPSWGLAFASVAAVGLLGPLVMIGAKDRAGGQPRS